MHIKCMSKYNIMAYKIKHRVTALTLVRKIMTRIIFYFKLPPEVKHAD